MRKARLLSTVAGGVLISALAGCATHPPSMAAVPRRKRPGASTDIETVVVIYAENRSFDNLYGNFPGANGLANATAGQHAAARPRRQRAQGAAADLGRPDRQGRDAAGHPGADRASAEPAVRHRRPEGLQPAARHDHPRPLASLLPEPDADRRRQERQVRRLGRLRRAGRWATTTARRCRCGRSPSSTRWPTTSSWARFGGSFLNHSVAGLRLRAATIPNADTSPAKPTIAVGRRRRRRR